MGEDLEELGVEDRTVGDKDGRVVITFLEWAGPFFFFFFPLSFFFPCMYLLSPSGYFRMSIYTNKSRPHGWFRFPYVLSIRIPPKLKNQDIYVNRPWSIPFSF